MKLKWMKVIEAGVVAMVTGLVAFAMFVSLDQCTDKVPYDADAIVAKVGDKLNMCGVVLVCLTFP
ncbi:hypothetical protein DPMN_126370 [Dreissena polymorpha]|uniref:Uncharacterized protein n=1 Tax=Dreissena polymorpha TaxID=45954 RepID=A0A9D4GZ88_DREPO|nr:hypothetical protein DPMN_126370 [Dreissena polymorpha]